MRILILEDDPIIALDLEFILEAGGHTVVGICDSLKAARMRLTERFDFALLDVDLKDGKSFEIASALDARRTPYAFLSASQHSDMPDHLRAAPFLSKPYQHAAVIASVPAGMPATA